jgi:hypothetical protein
MRILLDLDGVIASFHQTVLVHAGVPEIYERWPKGVYMIQDVIPHATLFSLWGNSPAPPLNPRVQAHFPLPTDLFRKLPLMPDAGHIIDTVQSFDPNFRICTSCPTQFLPIDLRSRWSHVAGDKTYWVQNHFGHEFHRLHISDYKEDLANPETVLIDDSEHVLSKFREAGGHTILVPRPWNNGTELPNAKDMGEYLWNSLTTMKKKINNYRFRNPTEWRPLS